MEPISTNLPTEYGHFVMTVWKDLDGKEPLILQTPNLNKLQPVLVRVHSECITGDNFRSFKCDCGPQKELALNLINHSQNGIFIYLRQEGRGIGLYEKIKAYQLQDTGYDTYDANIALGYLPDAREYSQVKMILDSLNISDIKLLTNNPDKVSAIQNLGINVIERIDLITESNEYNQNYIKTKKDRFKHYI